MNFIKNIFAQLFERNDASQQLWHQQQLAELNDIKMLIGKMAANEGKNDGVLDNLFDAEFKVFSQWGDDGIIQYLVNRLDVQVKTFIEFGVSDYNESNTRFLLLNNNWSGLVLDSSDTNVTNIKKNDMYWKYNLTAVSTFVNSENINETFLAAGFSGEVGLLHIDIDGNDYWLWKAIEVVSPVIAIIEYNSLFGCNRAISIPYEPKFDRFKAHFSGIYAGVSLPALCDMAEEKGYSFVGSNSAGNNAYFVRNDRLGDLKPLRAEQGYIESKFRESRDEFGYLTFLSGDEAMKLVRGMSIYNTRSKKIEEL